MIPQQLARAYPDVPELIRETLVFQYVAGANFVSWAYKSAGWRGVDALLARPPRSTEQLLHPEKYFVRPEYPLSIRLGGLAPYMRGEWEFAEETTLGELMIHLLAARSVDDGRAIEAAAGWDGDRLAAFVRGPDVGLVWLTAWDSANDARQFFDVYAEVLAARHPGTTPVRTGDTITLADGAPYHLERRDEKVLAVEGPLDPDLTALAERVWQRTRYEVTLPWVPLEMAAGERDPGATADR
jgi:hypothetical protein